MKHTETYTSCMHAHVRFHIYEPKVILRIKGVIQIHHGIGEHADLYDHFAAFLCHQGFVVVVSDFVGHGKSLIDLEQGYFGKVSGTKNLVKDMHHLQEVMKLRYPDTPYFMIGHDIGATLVQKYASVYGDYIEGAILLGPLSYGNSFSNRYYFACMSFLRGPMHRSQHFFEKLQYKRNKRLKAVFHNDVEWMTSSEKEQKVFLKDPMTHFTYTIQGYRDIMSCVKEVNTEESIRHIPKYLSILIAQGKCDPIPGGENLYKKYLKHNIRDLTFTSFENKRHALLFEENKEEVYQSILQWLNERTYL